MRGALRDRATVTLVPRGERGSTPASGDHLVIACNTGQDDDGDEQFISSVNNVLANAATCSWTRSCATGRCTIR